MTYKQLLPGDWDDAALKFSKFECTPSFKSNILNGISVKGEPSPIIHIEDLTKRPSDFLSGSGMPAMITAERVTKFFRSSSDAPFIEFINPIMSNYDNKEKYTILSILEPLDAFDWEKSQYELFNEPGPKGNKVIRKVKEMAFREDVINGRSIFHLQEFPVYLFISETLEQALISSGFKGFKTLPAHLV